MTGVAAGLVCLGWVCIAVLFVPARPPAEPARPWLGWVLVTFAVIFFVIAAGMFFGLIKA